MRIIKNLRSIGSNHFKSWGVAAKDAFDEGFISQYGICGPAGDCEASDVEHGGRRDGAKATGQ